MKALIASLALAIAMTGPALAFDAYNVPTIMPATQKADTSLFRSTDQFHGTGKTVLPSAGSNTQSFGFAGVRADGGQHKTDTPSEGGIPQILQ